MENVQNLPLDKMGTVAVFVIVLLAMVLVFCAKMFNDKK